MLTITDIMYGKHAAGISIRQPWKPSLGTYPVNGKIGYLYIAEDNGIVTSDNTAHVKGSTVIYTGDEWVSLVSNEQGAVDPTLRLSLEPNKTVSFGGNFIYGTPDNPINQTGIINVMNGRSHRRAGGELVIFHNSSTPPTLQMDGSPWIRQGYNTYIPGSTNMIVARLLYGTRIDYVIVPAEGSDT